MLRLWPGVVLVALQWIGRFVVPLVVPGATPFGVLAGMVGGLAILVWWVFFSRALWLERVGAIVLMVVAVFATKLIVHPSIAGGMMGLMLPVYAVPVLSLALVVWAAVTKNFATGPRRAALVLAVALACGTWALVRTGGFSSGLKHDWAWRWASTPEDRLLAQSGAPKAVPPAAVPAKSGASWPGFRGPNRDSIVRGVRIATDWVAAPPAELWRRQVGPGWSSFAVNGGLLYTQEQRGDDEVVACYNLTNGD
ncbi:MAG: hypothetical protein ABIR80_10535, partial [Opitutaceae bacterium]